MLLRRGIMVATIMAVNSFGASVDAYVEVPTFLITTTARNESPQRIERSYSAQIQAFLETVPGVPAIDYPVYSGVPLTDFTCYGKFYGGK